MRDKLLQISSAFSIQKIYVNLVSKLSERGYRQIIYVPVRNADQINGNRDESIENSEYHYSHILKNNLLFKLRFRRKIQIIYKDLLSKVDIESVGLVHAHFLFSDGGVAYLLNKEFGIPYVVNVRATDLFYFFRLMVYERRFGNKIMESAERVIFINPTYVNLLKEKYLSSFFKNFESKVAVIPNAIDDKWFSTESRTKELSQPIKLLYVGQIIERKKLDIVIKAMNLFNSKSKTLATLDIVGSGPFLKKVEILFNENVKYWGRINDFNSLFQIFNDCHIFLMPSIKETFGLVYIEALSQGLPIVFCKDEAVDGFFPNLSTGVAVPPNDVNETSRAIEYIIENYNEMSKSAVKLSSSFRWENVAGKHHEIYEKIIG
ncbi:MULTISPECIES: glycosyltransferase family 4 protein [Bacteroidota]|uniref:Glycosyltransferase family 4 protein n=1 Tax=Euzebyella saccharophila TaxID=679664 RepID=A0ABV8JLW0_9FLAO|nr:MULTISPECIES: glycosyltransferase family 4 protein [Bacteroidota]MBC6997549.1 glycosyltransferase family 4 protein [Cytophaga sp. FL35]